MIVMGVRVSLMQGVAATCVLSQAQALVLRARALEESLITATASPVGASGHIADLTQLLTSALSQQVPQTKDNFDVVFLNRNFLHFINIAASARCHLVWKTTSDGRLSSSQRSRLPIYNLA